MGTLVRLTPHALLSLSSLTLWNVEDGSVREYATASRSLSDNTELIAGVNFGAGSLGGEFAGWNREQIGVDFRLPDFVYTYFKAYF